MRPWLIGVTGNIACGKSTVMERLAELGATVIDGDAIYREMTGPDSALVRTLAREFGQQIVAADGSLDRPALAGIVFSDPDALRRLDRLTHPPIVAEVLRRTALAPTPVVATEGIKLIESGLGDRCDEVWVVTCDLDQQRARLMRRNGLTRTEADRRIASQSPAREKIARADVVLANDGAVDDLREQVDRAWIASDRKRRDVRYLPLGYES